MVSKIVNTFYYITSLTSYCTLLVSRRVQNYSYPINIYLLFVGIPQLDKKFNKIRQRNVVLREKMVKFHNSRYIIF